MTVEKVALNMACEWLEKQGVCCYFGECKKDKTQSGVCAKCLSRHFIRSAKNMMAKEPEDDE